MSLMQEFKKATVRLIVRRHFLFPILFLLGVLVSLTTLCAVAEEPTGPDQRAKVAGSWQISWEARIATEKGTVHFQQDGTKLTGTYNGPAGSPSVSGTVDGKKVSFTFGFPGKYPYSLVFSGLVENDKMNGEFTVGDMKDGYDSHGENARPTDYSWKATRMPDQAGRAKTEQPDKVVQPASR
jgi:hypothetical protein